MNPIGIDLHKKRSCYVVVDLEGQIIRKHSVPSTPESFQREFAYFDPGQT